MSARLAPQGVTPMAAQAACLLRAPWQWRGNDSRRWALHLVGAGLALLLVMPAVAMLVWLPARLAAVVLALLAGMWLTLLWAVQFGALMRLDHPHAARAVPGHAEALRRTAVGLWLVLVVCASLVAMAAAVPLGAEPARMGLTAALCAATMLLVVACGFRWWWSWPLLPLLGALSGMETWRHLLGQAWTTLRPLWQAQPWGVAVLALVLQGWLLSRLFGRGDAAHVRIYAQRERMRHILAAGAVGQKPALAAYGRWGEWLGQPMQQLVDAWLARVCHRASPQTASVLARADIVLLGVQHWVRQLGALLIGQALAALIVAAALLLTPMAGEQYWRHAALGLAIGVFSMAAGVVLGMPGAMWLSRREQALLMLLPGMPQGAALNRALAWRQLRQTLWLWAALLPAVLALLAVGHQRTVVVLAGVLPLQLAWLWRDASRLRAPQPAGVLLPLALGLMLAVLSWVGVRAQPGLLLPWLLAMAVASAVLLAWRWRRLARLPQALPAGRLG